MQSINQLQNCSNIVKFGLGNVSTYHGIGTTSSSDIALGSWIWDDDLSFTGGYNTIKNNVGARVYVESSTPALLGELINNTFRIK